MGLKLISIEGGPFGKDVKAGPIFKPGGDMILLALRDVALGDAGAADALIRPDFSRVPLGEKGTDAANFWWGWVDFYQ